MDELRRGWKIILGCALGTGTGVILLFFTFSLFVLPIIAEFGGTRGDFSRTQSLIILGLLGAPLLGHATDRFGFRAVFIGTMLIVIATEIAMASVVSDSSGFAICVAMLGFFGVGTTAVTSTRAISAWFDKQRGLALGLAASGTALTTLLVPPILEAVIANWGWRVGILTLAGLAAGIGLPAVWLLVSPEPDKQSHHFESNNTAIRDYSFVSDLYFWLMALSLIAMGVAGSAFIGQMSPIIQEKGLSSTAAAWALSAFAVGQLLGRLLGGAALDRFDPRWVAILLNLFPVSGYFLLAGGDVTLSAAIFAALLIGFQQGAELDIFAYFVSRLYPIARYGTVYGMLMGLSWIGNATGVIGVGHMHDLYGNYQIAMMTGAALLIIGTILIGLVRLPPRAAVLEPIR